MTGNLKIISDSRIRSIIAKGRKYRFPVQIDVQKCRKKLQDLLINFVIVGLKDWKLNIFKIIDGRISFSSSRLACKDSKYVYPAAGHVITGNLKIISDSRIRSIIAKSPNIDWSTAN